MIRIYVLKLHFGASLRRSTPDVQAHVLSLIGDDLVHSRAGVVGHFDVMKDVISVGRC